MALKAAPKPWRCCARSEWPSVWQAARDAIPRHYAVASWKYRTASQVEQSEVEPALKVKDRSPEQGDGDGPLECSLTLGKVASEARSRLHGAQRLGNLSWADAGGGARTAEEEYDQRVSA